MPTVKLTKAEIGRINAPDPSGRQVIHWDAELGGFGLLASGKTGAKTFIAQRRLPDGRSRRVTVGAVGEFEKVEDARRKAGKLLLDLRDGKDPKAERRRAAANTLRGVLALYLRTNNKLRDRSRESYRHAVERHLDEWLDRPLRGITPDMIEDKHAFIGEKTGPAAANGTMRAFRAMWNFARDRDSTLPENPTRRLKRAWYKLPARARHVRADDLAVFYAAVDALPSRAARDYLLLLLFTGLRRREAAALRWEDIDFAGGVIRLPADQTKAGRRLDLPMTDHVRSMLVDRRGLGNEGPFVFGADSRSGHIEEPKFPLQQVARTSGVQVSAHDLRRTFITIAETADISPIALKALINHTLGNNDVTNNYIQMTVNRLQEPAQRVCDRLKKLCKINESAKTLP